MSKWKPSQFAWAVFFFCVTAAFLSPAQTVTTLHNFDGMDGSYPLSSLLQGPDGDYFGTTSAGGSSGPFGPGTVFKVRPDGVVFTLHNFSGSDGNQPMANLLLATDGNFYGTTWQGGPSNYGVIFKITPSGTFTLLYSFTGGSDGNYPGQLIQGSDGDLYGTALGGGNDNCQVQNGCGVIFQITLQGAFSKIYQFDGSKGYNPGGLVQGRDGNFYGVTAAGGNGCNTGCGTIFQLTPAGTLTSLHNFVGNDGNWPNGQLLQANDGNFYGVTVNGGVNDQGTVFKITSSGAFTSLYSFCPDPQANCPDGANPVSGLMQAADGTLYGTTTDGGSYGYEPFGTIFTITPSGSLTTLFSFNNASNGGTPAARLLQDSNGNFFGATSGGGSSHYGTIFQFYTTGETLTVSESGYGTVTSTDGIINCPGTCTHVYPNNTQVTLNATPGQGWDFTGWTGACSGTGSCTFDMTQDQTVSATFLPLYTLTVSTTGNGSVKSTDGFINCPGVCSHTYVAYTSVTLNNYPAPGWAFNSWNGGCIGNNPTCIISMSNNLSVGATFIQSSYTLTASVSGQGTITSTDGNINCPGVCSHTYLSLTQVTLNATPASGWNFSGWSGQCTGLGPCNLTMLGNYGVSAYFMQPGNGLQFTSVAPCRLIDTRQTGTPIGGGSYENFNIPQLGGCNIPSTASAYSLNVTVVPLGQLRYLTVWPAGLAQPLTSTMNSRDGRTKASAVIVQAGSNDAISIYATDTTNAILDINGYFSAPGAQTYQYYPITPCRVIDTRNADGNLSGPPLVGGQQRNFPVTESSCIPQGVDIQAYSFNFTVVSSPPGQPMAYLTVWPDGQQQPTVSTLNNRTATTVANAAIVPAGSNGAISVYASQSTQLVVDINGYFAAPASGGLSLYPAPPCRVIDTRNDNGQPFQGKLTVDVAGSPCAPSSEAQAYVFNTTVAPPDPMHYLTLWPDPEQRPEVSTLNAVDGAVTSNMAIVPNTNGSTDAFASDPTQLILDISSYFAP